MNNEINEHIENALNQMRTLFVKAAQRIEAIKPGEKLPATELAKEIARENNTGSNSLQMYHNLKILLENYPGVDIRRGAQGGIYRLQPGETPGQKKTVVKKSNKSAVELEVEADDVSE